METMPLAKYFTHLDVVRGHNDIIRMFGKRQYNALSEYAQFLDKSSKPLIVRPGILDKLPESIEINLGIIDHSVEPVREESYAFLAGLDPVPDFEQIRKQLGFDDLPDIIQSNERILDFVHRITGKWHESGLFGIDFHRAIKKQIYQFMKAGNTSLPFQELKRAIVLYTVLQAVNEDIKHAILLSATITGPQITLQNALTELLFRRIKASLASLAYLDLGKLCQSVKIKIQKLGFRPGVKAMLSNDLNSVKSISEYENVANTSIPGKLHKLGTPEPDIKRVLHILQSGLTDLARLSSLYERWFLTPSLAQHQKLYVPKRIGKMTVRFLPKLTEKKQTITLYPSKDLLEFLKGNISNDCTADTGRARHHLEAKKFFNIRVFVNREWVGNMYCLDLSLPYNFCIIDKIQIPGQFMEQWAGFFPALQKAFTTAFGSIMVLVPSDISNSRKVREAFATYKMGLQEKQYVPNSFSESRHLYYFECNRSKRFLVFSAGKQEEESPALILE